MKRLATERWEDWLEGGDGELFARIVGPAIPHALAAARRAGLPPEDAEDVLQDCLVQLVREKSRRPGVIGIVPWLVRLTRLRSISAARSKHRRRRLEKRAETLSVPESTADALSLREEVERALSMLSPSEREIVLLRHLHDLDYGEIGRILSVSPAACRVRVHRALAVLRRKLGANASTMISLLTLPVSRADSALISSALAAGRALISTSAGGLPAVSSAGVLLMGTKSSLALGAALLLFLSGSIEYALQDRAAPEPPASSATIPSAIPATLLAEQWRLVEENGTLKRLLREKRTPGEAPADEPPAAPLARRGALAVFVEGALSGVRIHLRGAPSPTASPLGSTGGRELDLTTDSSGRALSPALEPGLYAVTLRFPGGYITREVDVGPGQFGEVRLAAPRGMTVAGTLARFEGDTVAGASLLLWEKELAFECESASDGGFCFENVPAGKYRLRIAARRERAGGFVAFRDVEFLTGGCPPLDITVRVPNFHGTIVDDETDQPIPGARVTVESPHLAKWAVTDREGRWSLVDLYPAGMVDLLIAKEGYRSARLSHVEVRSGQAREMPVRLVREGAK